MRIELEDESFDSILDFLLKQKRSIRYMNNSVRTEPTRSATMAPPYRTNPPLRTLATGIEEDRECPFHGDRGHDLNQCRGFSMMSIARRRDWLRTHNRCFRCSLERHVMAQCTESVRCGVCDSNLHVDAMHVHRRPADTD